MNPPSPLWRRLVGFTMLPAIAAISPLLVLPAVSRTAGAGGWASAIAGEAVGTFAAIVIGYGWAAIGPALVSIARDDTHRGELYRESLVVRSILALAVLPLAAVVCWLVATPGAEWLSVLMGMQGALIALTFAWYSAGIGDPRAIVVYDAVPRLIAAVLALFAILQTGWVLLYPIAGIVVTIVGTGLFTLRLLREHPARWPGLRDLPRLFRAGGPVTLNDIALGAFSNIPTPLVTATSAGNPIAAAGFATADKMLKLGQFLPVTLANALQAWIAERTGRERGLRMRRALLAHGAFGVLGCIVLTVAGPWVSLVLFGADAAASWPVLLAMGVVFAFFSLRTSMSRHVLFPAGKASTVMRATLIGTAVGVPLMIALALTIGPLGAAIGYALTEGAATLLLIRAARAALRTLDEVEPIEP